METVQLYISEILTAEEAVKRLRYSKQSGVFSYGESTGLLAVHREEKV